VCVGIDPHDWLLERWELDVSAAGAREFGLRVVDAVAGRAGIVKPQVSFFERFGSSGFQALERVLAEARAAGLVIIGDAKRGDIGTTMDAYASAWLQPGSPLEVDALTVAPYLGLGSLAGTVERARAYGKGLFVLAATSNPEAAGLQQAYRADVERSVAASILGGVAHWNDDFEVMGSFGVVLGATLSLREFGIPTDSELTPVLPILAPGFGAQGAEFAQMSGIFGALAKGVIVSESRSLLELGPLGLVEALERRRDEIARYA
ncbi:MAG TPA: orotidine-5'-phosphate decarboxylase, partial [Microbacteriaceae bacterium]|nr:orotidine-5'-phosphate decarboxylase [Microbacteriaceae bacterium]